MERRAGTSPARRRRRTSWPTRTSATRSACSQGNEPGRLGDDAVEEDRCDSGNAAPRALEKPAISGKAQVGETLTADPGRWAEGPSDFSYQWQLCEDGANCKDIVGATGKTYGVRSSDRDGMIRVQVTAKNLVGSTTSNSDTTAAVTTGTSPTPTPTPAPTPVGVGGAVSITGISLPNRLVISSIRSRPA